MEKQTATASATFITGTTYPIAMSYPNSAKSIINAAKTKAKMDLWKRMGKQQDQQQQQCNPSCRGMKHNIWRSGKNSNNGKGKLYPQNESGKNYGCEGNQDIFICNFHQKEVQSRYSIKGYNDGIQAQFKKDQQDYLVGQKVNQNNCRVQQLELYRQQELARQSHNSSSKRVSIQQKIEFSEKACKVNAQLRKQRQRQAQRSKETEREQSVKRNQRTQLQNKKKVRNSNQSSSSVSSAILVVSPNNNTKGKNKVNKKSNWKVPKTDNESKQQQNQENETENGNGKKKEKQQLSGNNSDNDSNDEQFLQQAQADHIQVSIVEDQIDFTNTDSIEDVMLMADADGAHLDTNPQPQTNNIDTTTNKGKLNSLDKGKLHSLSFPSPQLRFQPPSPLVTDMLKQQVYSQQLTIRAQQLEITKLKQRNQQQKQEYLSYKVMLQNTNIQLNRELDQIVLRLSHEEQKGKELEKAFLELKERVYRKEVEVDRDNEMNKNNGKKNKETAIFDPDDKWKWNYVAEQDDNDNQKENRRQNVYSHINFSNDFGQNSQIPFFAKTSYQQQVQQKDIIIKQLQQQVEGLKRFHCQQLLRLNEGADNGVERSAVDRSTAQTSSLAATARKRGNKHFTFAQQSQPQLSIPESSSADSIKSLQLLNLKKLPTTQSREVSQGQTEYQDEPEGESKLDKQESSQLKKLRQKNEIQKVQNENTKLNDVSHSNTILAATSTSTQTQTTKFIHENDLLTITQTQPHSPQLQHQHQHQHQHRQQKLLQRKYTQLQQQNYQIKQSIFDLQQKLVQEAQNYQKRINRLEKLLIMKECNRVDRDDMNTARNRDIEYLPKESRTINSNNKCYQQQKQVLMQLHPNRNIPAKMNTPETVFANKVIQTQTKTRAQTKSLPTTHSKTIIATPIKTTTTSTTMMTMMTSQEIDNNQTLIKKLQKQLKQLKQSKQSKQSKQHNSYSLQSFQQCSELFQPQSCSYQQQQMLKQKQFRLNQHYCPSKQQPQTYHYHQPSLVRLKPLKQSHQQLQCNSPTRSLTRLLKSETDVKGHNKRFKYNNGSNQNQQNCQQNDFSNKFFNNCKCKGQCCYCQCKQISNNAHSFSRQPLVKSPAINSFKSYSPSTLPSPSNQLCGEPKLITSTYNMQHIRQNQCKINANSKDIQVESILNALSIRDRLPSSSKQPVRHGRHQQHHRYLSDHQNFNGFNDFNDFNDFNNLNDFNDFKHKSTYNHNQQKQISSKLLLQEYLNGNKSKCNCGHHHSGYVDYPQSHHLQRRINSSSSMMKKPLATKTTNKNNKNNKCCQNVYLNEQSDYLNQKRIKLKNIQDKVKQLKAEVRNSFKPQH